MSGDLSHRLNPIVPWSSRVAHPGLGERPLKQDDEGDDSRHDHRGHGDQHAEDDLPRARTGPPVEPSDERCHDDDKKKPEAIVVWADERRDPDERPCYEGHPLRRARSSCTPGHRREGFYLRPRMRLSSGHAAVHPRYGFLSPLMPQSETRKRSWKRKPKSRPIRSSAPRQAKGASPRSRSRPLKVRSVPEPILPGQAWDLGHVDGDGLRYAGPEHRHSRDCPEGGNRATARHRKARELRLELERPRSRDW